MTLRLALPLAVLLAGCQAGAPDPKGGAVPGSAEARRVGLTEGDVRTCRGLGAFAAVVTDGRRQGIARAEALESARAGPLTPLFETIVNGVYDAPRPQSAVGWRELRRTYGRITAAGCLQSLGTA